MKYRGRVRNGVVVLDMPNGLSEGTVVEVEPLTQPAVTGARPGSAQAVLRHAGIWQADNDEVDRLLDEIRRSKEAEVDSRQGEGANESLD